jgi:hypothetical protein
MFEPYQVDEGFGFSTAWLLPLIFKVITTARSERETTGPWKVELLLGDGDSWTVIRHMKSRSLPYR